MESADEEQPLLLDHLHPPPDDTFTRSSAAATDANAIESPKNVSRTGGGWEAPVAMVMVQLFQTGLVLLSKVVISHGMFVFALVTYRSAFGTAFLLPLALICERDKWKEINWRVSRWIIFNAFIGYAVPINLYYNGLRDTTSSYAIIFLNIIPLITFILSITFKMERLKFATMAGSLKIVGVLVSVGGTMVITFYKGNELHLWNSILQYHKNEEEIEVPSNHLRGTILLLASSFAYASWYLIQSKVHEVYPYKYWSSMATCLVGGLMTAIAGVVVTRDGDAWKLGWDLKLLTVVYSGALATAGKYSLNSWVVAKRGPAYPPMFSPLSLVFTVVLGSIILGDSITIGSLLGTTMVIAGLYVFLWAKSKDLPSK